ncbi:hypothetical protein QUF88_19170 [Bacillus sp. DX1.1]|uniref:hypothetical protein n=1 Tax=unclassified Bacillus (in: firmicutes) TaxID=185979 RepID=UPI00257068DA|nr:MULTISPECIES: hypothetical protein [unclassified Bacillus (in: firmicutes)]MDM5155833.1 hypothetical protein [Bacillus sp. DX1.1]WJE80130.1 hypothetical protein QRE67_16700 [Bacillus sp. DX3.1]
MNEILKKYVNPEISILLFGFLGSIKLLMDSLGYHIITDDIISAVVSFVCWGIAIGTMVTNTYLSKNRQKQKETLKNKGLL